MNPKYFISLLLLTICISAARSQDINDSAFAARTLRELLNTCRKIDYADPKVQRFGNYYWSAPFILCNWIDKKHERKEFADYLKDGEKKKVDDLCSEINSTVNKDKNYSIVQYIAQHEGEYTWHILVVSYLKNGVEKRSSFTFIKMKDRFGLEDYRQMIF